MWCDASVHPDSVLHHIHNSYALKTIDSKSPCIAMPWCIRSGVHAMAVLLMGEAGVKGASVFDGSVFNGDIGNIFSLLKKTIRHGTVFGNI